MKTTDKRKRSDSTQSAIEAVQNAAKDDLMPPDCVVIGGDEKPFWNAIIHARPRSLWTEIDLIHAANLARCQASVERLTMELISEGDIVDGKVNPKHALIETLSRRAISLARFLHVHAEAVVGRSRDQKNVKDLEDKAKSKDYSDLIPTLRAVK